MSIPACQKAPPTSPLSSMFGIAGSTKPRSNEVEACTAIARSLHSPRSLREPPGTRLEPRSSTHRTIMPYVRNFEAGADSHTIDRRDRSTAFYGRSRSSASGLVPEGFTGEKSPSHVPTRSRSRQTTLRDEFQVVRRNRDAHAVATRQSVAGARTPTERSVQPTYGGSSSSSSASLPSKSSRWMTSSPGSSSTSSRSFVTYCLYSSS